MIELPELDLQECFAVSCPEQLPDSETAPETPARACDLGERTALGVSWRRVEPRVRDCPEVGACELTQPVIAPTDAGRLWMLAKAYDPDSDDFEERGVLLALYDTDGRTVIEQMPDLADDQREKVNYRLSAAADTRGHLFMAVTKLLRSSHGFESWLAEYGADGELLARRSLAPGVRLGPDLALSGADGLAVGQFEGAGGIALIGTDGTVRWTQSSLGATELTQLVSDASGRVTITTGSGKEQLLEQYDPRGNRSWSRRFDRLEGLALAADHRGGVVRAGMIQLQWPGIGHALHVHKLDSTGSTVWRTEMPVSQPFNQITTVIDARGNFLVPGTVAAFGRERASVHELSEDGMFCRTFEIDDVELASVDQIATSPSGHELFFESTRNLSPTESELSFGRLAYSPP